MKKTLLFLSFVAIGVSVFAQKKVTQTATVTFDATTPKDELPKAQNSTVIASIDPKTGAVAFEAPVKNFAFTNPTIQDHFNGEKWMNSNTYPSFTFAGKIQNIAKHNLSKNGTYSVKVDGTLKVKDKEQKVTVPATITVADGKISTVSNFTIKLADYGITGGPIDGGKVAAEPKISVNATF